ncbi:putative methylesterase 11, chloroplastic [Arachis ipaensis]|uniref:putative methylesterase 11, chloroplastic n=1 Tax=Arachis ipaensis TaxID=130454 RepID=UPI0007AF6B52|nr:putative methylesterase 11, chloroplastic [Arachis ipaensis]XP_029148399.1 putative methylesterase 11, chloroplastic [Arachis hypogaea]
MVGIKVDDLETNHFVLVHGGGFGAWCWYKTIALLEEAGYKVSAIDLTGSGVHSFDTNNIKSLSQYVKPLTDFVEKLPEGEKVILAGHDFGGHEGSDDLMQQAQIFLYANGNDHPPTAFEDDMLDFVSIEEFFLSELVITIREEIPEIQN